jgi:RNA polymerase sporulation-specific sigma factor
MNYDLEENDNELLSLVSEENEEAMENLMKKYSNVVAFYVNKYIAWAKTYGLDEKDLNQEALLALSYAIKNFQKEKCVTFYTYASVCIDCNLRCVIRNSSRNKFKMLNESVSLEQIFEDTVSQYYDIVKDETLDPSLKVIVKENQKEIIEKLNKKLTEFEMIVFSMKLSGFNNDEIAGYLAKNKKSIENTVFRIKNKYKKVINE